MRRLIDINCFAQLDNALKAMQETHDTNIEAMETYIEIFRRKKSNINSKIIKSIYRMFSENRANQIFYEKQAIRLQSEIDERALQRYYARVIELGIKKISYYWQNVGSLGFLSSNIVSFMKELYSLYNDTYKRKNLKSHFKLLQLLFKQNSEVENKIYHLLIEEGYLSSMDEFYRINGIGLVGDKHYTRKSSDDSEPESVEAIFTPQCTPEEDSADFIKDKTLSQTKKKIKAQVRNRQRSITPNQMDKDNKKIKKTMETMLNNMKTNFEHQKKEKKLGVIKEESASSSRKSFEEDCNSNTNRSALQPKSRQNASNVIERLSRSKETKTHHRQRISLEMMGYFSNELKSVISHANVKEIDFDNISQVIVTTESNNKTKRKSEINSLNTNALNKMDSSSEIIINNQRNRGKIIDLATKRKLSRQMDMFCQQLNQAQSMKNMLRKSQFSPKFSFRSAPGVYISFGQEKLDSNGMYDSKDPQTKIKAKGNKFRIKAPQILPNQPIFENQAILNELAAQQNSFCSTNKNMFQTCSSKQEVKGAELSNISALMIGFTSQSMSNRQNSTDKRIRTESGTYDKLAQNGRNPFRNYLLASKGVIEETKLNHHKPQNNSQHIHKHNKKTVEKGQIESRSIMTGFKNVRQFKGCKKRAMYSSCARYAVFDRRRREVILAR